ncbi:hypothetical protein TNCV_4524241 [Trichonephila clavipes]|nr:hypothetical protein TNCV_4524241 [Trichonephila clavipes]
MKNLQNAPTPQPKLQCLKLQGTTGPVQPVNPRGWGGAVILIRDRFPHFRVPTLPLTGARKQHTLRSPPQIREPFLVASTTPARIQITSQKLGSRPRRLFSIFSQIGILAAEICGADSASTLDYALIKEFEFGPVLQDSIPELSSDHNPVGFALSKNPFSYPPPELNTTWSIFTLKNTPANPDNFLLPTTQEFCPRGSRLPSP